MNLSSSLFYYIQRVGIIGLFTCLFFLSAAVHARLPDGELFAQGDPQALQAVAPSIVTRQRAVEVVHTAIDQDFDILYLNLFDDVYIEVLKDHVVIDASGNYAWNGTVEGVNESQVTIVVSGETLSANIILPEVYYHLRPIEGNTHVVREIDPLALQDTTAPLSLSNSYEPSVLSNSEVLDNSGTQMNSPVPAANSTPQAQTIFFSEEQAVFDRVNQERAIVGLPPLAANESLTVAARNHSQDMSANNYFSHDSQDGRSPAERITNAGYSWNNYGENIAMGYTTPEMVMNGWMTSSGHRANILRESFCDLGVGYEPVGNYWTQDFGRQQGMQTCPDDGGGSGGGNGGSDGGGGGNDGSNGGGGGNGGSNGGGGSIEVIENGQTKSGLSASSGNWIYYRVVVPAGATDLNFSISGGSGDADIYTRQGGQPTASRYNCRPYRSGNNETCHYASPSEGEYYIGIRAYNTFSGVSLTVSYAEPESVGAGNRSSGESNGDDAIHETNLGTSIGDWLHFNIDVPAGATSLSATINGGSGDADLYVRHGAQPTFYQWHFRPYLYGNNEAVNVISPPAGTWYISIRAYSAYSGISLDVTYD